mmetsp:Transcript_19746/g.33186  ORF Transcript_19746/g.33186 Transcript_19746/m.33186 type:complete len:274 (-) Transcript_19746:450-1271(-)|eukprot:CAMPEP_0198209206 /NCGR_PEP_ID=MMETSP1445-20131203/13932_1 /TAXON_ID=36898 /ORGANISM="Pyramimonas sp., Strain CCMP2087" /LENGTH=273 /DNA_ID=CAMNT_0043882895 /DNA_START=95 /DNA_END=916 /DNA_ORIENTATION=+
MNSLSLRTVSCRSVANNATHTTSRTACRITAKHAQPVASSNGLRMCNQMQQRQSLIGAHNQTFMRACRNAVPALHRSHCVQVVAEEGEEEMMIEEEAKEKFEKTLTAVEQNFNSVRTGRANASLLDRLMVSYYGASTSLKSMATVSTPDSQTVAIQPFDKTAIKDIERAIQTSDIGIMPSNDGNVIRLNVPALTEDRRKELAKVVSKLGEEGKVALRNVRRDAAQQYKKLEKDGKSSKDSCEGYCKSLDEMTNVYVKKVDEIIKKKSEEIMKV